MQIWSVSLVTWRSKHIDYQTHKVKVMIMIVLFISIARNITTLWKVIKQYDNNNDIIKTSINYKYPSISITWVIMIDIK